MSVIFWAFFSRTQKEVYADFSGESGFFLKGIWQVHFSLAGCSWTMARYLF